MSDHFYTHIIEIDSVYTALNDLDLAPEEKQDLVVLVEQTVHHIVLDTVMTELPEEDKKTFLFHVDEKDHDKVWDLLKAKIDNAEEKIKLAVSSAKEDLHADIYAVRNTEEEDEPEEA